MGGRSVRVLHISDLHISDLHMQRVDGSQPARARLEAASRFHVLGAKWTANLAEICRLADLADGAEARRLMADRVDLLLHGHQHEPAAEVLVRPDHQMLLLATARAAGASSRRAM